MRVAPDVNQSFRAVLLAPRQAQRPTCVKKCVFWRAKIEAALRLTVQQQSRMAPAQASIVDVKLVRNSFTVARFSCES